MSSNSMVCTKDYAQYLKLNNAQGEKSHYVFRHAV